MGPEDTGEGGLQPGRQVAGNVQSVPDRHRIRVSDAAVHRGETAFHRVRSIYQYINTSLRSAKALSP